MATPCRNAHFSPSARFDPPRARIPAGRGLAAVAVAVAFSATTACSREPPPQGPWARIDRPEGSPRVGAVTVVEAEVGDGDAVTPPPDLALSWNWTAPEADRAWTEAGEPAGADGRAAWSWTPEVAGPTTLTLTVTDGDGLEGSASVEVTVLDEAADTGLR